MGYVLRASTWDKNERLFRAGAEMKTGKEMMTNTGGGNICMEIMD
jgi:hypothetical protein